MSLHIMTGIMLWLFPSLLLVLTTETKRGVSAFTFPAKGKAATAQKTTANIISSTRLCNAKSTIVSNVDKAPSHVFIGGLGYCGIRIAAVFRASYPECKISGCVRSTERKRAVLAGAGGALDASARPFLDAVHVFDLDEAYAGLDEEGIADILQASHIIQTIAPIADFDRDPLLALHGSRLMRNENNNSHLLRWVGYLSSTGVYGNYDGEWVTEESELRCVDQKSLARVEAEREWRLFEKRLNDEKENDDDNVRIDCFRCGGIYGPGRGPLFSARKTTTATSTASKSTAPTEKVVPKYVNRILVDDICGALLAAASSDRPRRTSSGGRVYNLVDDDPAPRGEITREANRLLGADGGESEDTPAAGNAAGNGRRGMPRNTGNKRCRNRRLKDDCGWKLDAPTFREGLALLLETANRG